MTTAIPDRVEDRKNGWQIEYYNLPNGVQLRVARDILPLSVPPGCATRSARLSTNYELSDPNAARGYCVILEVANLILRAAGRDQLAPEDDENTI